ncbi:hypothetical protein, partial [Nocardia farcinica]|uniref:hypothetical protein n=1 Tax=Nocardia farcinica TaxID=37329 RepID=UPI002455E65D
DIVIMNPPYVKLAAGSAHRKRLRQAVVDCPNLYAAFLALGADGPVERVDSSPEPEGPGGNGHPLETDNSPLPAEARAPES